MKTSSILESIRNKINKIEKNNIQPTTISSDEHDDFEYIDDSSKDIVNSKYVPGSSAPLDPETNAAPASTQATDDDFDFLNNDEEEVVETKNTSKQVFVEPMKADIILPGSSNSDLDLELELEEDNIPANKSATDPFKNKNDDLDLEDLELDESLNKQAASVAKNSTPIKSSVDDLDLDNIDLDEDLTKSSPAPQSFASSLPNNDLDLENIDLEEDKPVYNINVEAPKIETPVQEAPKQHIPVFNQPVATPAPIQNNYQETRTNNISNRSSIISEDVAKKTSNAIREMVQSVPKTQNHQFLQSQAPAFRSGETIEDMVSAILAPKLEQWISENLPPMVEKIVKSEIKRLLPHQDDI